MLYILGRDCDCVLHFLHMSSQNPIISLKFRLSHRIYLLKNVGFWNCLHHLKMSGTNLLDAF